MIINHGVELHITLNQVKQLEETHAYLTDLGWIIPNWLIELRAEVEKNEIQR